MEYLVGKPGRIIIARFGDGEDMLDTRAIHKPAPASGFVLLAFGNAGNPP